MPQYSPLLTVMVAAVRKAGRQLNRDFGEVENLQVSRKGPGDFVSAADHKAEQTLFEELSKARPGYGFLMEERGAVEGTDKTHRWIVDPLDGTTNFLHGFAHFSISVGLQREGELVAGVVYDVAKNEMFTAEKGRGAFLNDRRLRVASRTSLPDALVVTGIAARNRTGDGKAKFQAELDRVVGAVADVRRLGSAALDLAYVAAGRFDAYWERNLAPWDVAAGAVLVREAGGFAREIDGADFMETGSIIATNERLLPLLTKTLRG
ncbi:MAG: inositol monophosphatase family protein [Hyphomonadaceae bacterium]|nr:inositol monophosphatase family protein [Hyphomonadaceae bacterium]